MRTGSMLTIRFVQDIHQTQLIESRQCRLVWAQEELVS